VICCLLVISYSFVLQSGSDCRREDVDSTLESSDASTIQELNYHPKDDTQIKRRLTDLVRSDKLQVSIGVVFIVCSMRSGRIQTLLERDVY